MKYLPDTNVLLAIAWPNHQHHRLAHQWFEKSAASGWWTCALTELGFARLSSNPAFTRQAVSPCDAIALLLELRKFGKHGFLAELPSVELLQKLPLAGHQQLNDALLVVLAERNKGALVTFDKATRAHATDPKSVLLLA
ncbi:MAG: PIN domain-containing protein [Myxococcales bacterium]